MQYLVLGRDNSNVDTIPCFRKGQFKHRYNTFFLGRENSNVDTIPCFRKEGIVSTFELSLPKAWY
jgi:VanZ family protein